MNAEKHFEKDRLYHEAIAGEYDSVVVAPRVLTNDRAFRRIGRSIRRGESMLDLGCGTGHMSLRFGNRFREVTAVDHSPGMLEQARLHLVAAGRKNVRILCSDVFDYVRSCPPASFDLIAATGFLHHVLEHDLAPLVAGVKRLLKPGGQLLIQEPIRLPGVVVPARIERWNAQSVVMKVHYHAQGEPPDEEPLDRAMLMGILEDNGLFVERELRNWEVFPQSLPPTFRDRVAAFSLNLLYGSAGNVLTVLLRSR